MVAGTVASSNATISGRTATTNRNALNRSATKRRRKRARRPIRRIRGASMASSSAKGAVGDGAGAATATSSASRKRAADRLPIADNKPSGGRSGPIPSARSYRLRPLGKPLRWQGPP